MLTDRWLMAVPASPSGRWSFRVAELLDHRAPMLGHETSSGRQSMPLSAVLRKRREEAGAPLLPTSASPGGAQPSDWRDDSESSLNRTLREAARSGGTTRPFAWAMGGAGGSARATPTRRGAEWNLRDRGLEAGSRLRIMGVKGIG